MLPLKIKLTKGIVYNIADNEEDIEQLQYTIIKLRALIDSEPLPHVFATNANEYGQVYVPEYDIWFNKNEYKIVE